VYAHHSQLVEFCIVASNGFWALFTNGCINIRGYTGTSRHQKRGMGNFHLTIAVQQQQHIQPGPQLHMHAAYTAL
jgi:hypothetical protein